MIDKFYTQLCYISNSLRDILLCSHKANSLTELIFKIFDANLSTQLVVVSQERIRDRWFEVGTAVS